MGHTQAVDSAFVKANASLESLCEKQVAEATTPSLHVAGEPAPDVPALTPGLFFVTIRDGEHAVRQKFTKQ